jgi:hypothetical protein
MGLFLVLFLCSSFVKDMLREDSRFGAFNSHLCPNKFPFSLRRELAGKGLIRLAVFAAKTAVIGKIEKIPGSTGITGNLPAAKRGGGAACNGADLRCPQPTVLLPPNRRVHPFASDGVRRTRPSRGCATGTASPPTHPVGYCTI